MLYHYVKFLLGVAYIPMGDPHDCIMVILNYSDTAQLFLKMFSCFIDCNYC